MFIIFTKPKHKNPLIEGGGHRGALTASGGASRPRTIGSPILWEKTATPNHHTPFSI
jgi:hypothetical protein